MTSTLTRAIFLLAGTALFVASAEGGKTFGTPEDARDALIRQHKKDSTRYEQCSARVPRRNRAHGR